MVHEQLPVIISTLIKEACTYKNNAELKNSLALDIFYTNVTIHTDQIIWSEQCGGQSAGVGRLCSWDRSSAGGLAVLFAGVGFFCGTAGAMANEIGIPFAGV